eukprot:TRINITY_DN20445_c0_g1_i1.p1 TRINITY_DN20445_c0_g1~~TRINITY_DN20445_c0_g1_i1.p1  ORF type:complete len:192 (+),score=17.13 TRINITY_DN20445_c0_g1_i1:125-700(+)
MTEIGWQGKKFQPRKETNILMDHLERIVELEGFESNYNHVPLRSSSNYSIFDMLRNNEVYPNYEKRNEVRKDVDDTSSFINLNRHRSLPELKLETPKRPKEVSQTPKISALSKITKIQTLEFVKPPETPIAMKRTTKNLQVRDPHKRTHSQGFRGSTGNQTSDHQPQSPAFLKPMLFSDCLLYTSPSPRDS